MGASEKVCVVKRNKRVEAIVHATMITSAQFWQREHDLMEQDRDRWKRVADMFATAEFPHEKVMAFEAWEELSSKMIPREVEEK